MNSFVKWNKKLEGEERMLLMLLEVFDIINEYPEVIPNTGKIIQNLKGKIEFKDLKFYYDKKAPLYDNFNLVIEPG